MVLLQDSCTKVHRHSKYLCQVPFVEAETHFWTLQNIQQMRKSTNCTHYAWEALKDPSRQRQPAIVQS